MKTKKGISPVIATTMLIGLVIVLGIIIALWFSNLTQESIVKFERNINQVCQEDVSFDVDLVGDYIEIRNTGVTPIYDFSVVVEGDGIQSTIDISDEEFGTGWSENGLEQGSLVSVELASGYQNSRLTFIPKLMGTSSEGTRVEYECGEIAGKTI